MTHPAIDAYLDELLDLTVDAVAPAPAAANAPSMAPVETVAACVDIPAGLLAELDADPLFGAVPHAHAEAPVEAAAPAPMIDAGLLAELDSDPLFAAATVPSLPMIDAGLLAELDSDPLFVAATTTAASVIDAGLLAELESDPLFAADLAASPSPSAPPVVEAHVTPAARTPARPVSNASMGLRPVEFTPPALPPSVTDTHRWLRVAVGEDSYALELLRVQEVGRTSPIVAVRGAAPSVLGVMNLRGRIVPVFDLGLWLGTGCVRPDERARIVVVERDNELIGALVSAVDDVVTLGPDRIEPPLMASPSRAIVGVARVVAKPTVLLDANALFA